MGKAQIPELRAQNKSLSERVKSMLNALREAETALSNAEELRELYQRKIDYARVIILCELAEPAQLSAEEKAALKADIAALKKPEFPDIKYPLPTKPTATNVLGIIADEPTEGVAP